jgi:hypothetical protein
MEYSTPELVVLGSASALVLGDEIGSGDNGFTDVTKPPMGIALGLDD